jgi:hypothetical protein
MSPAAKIVLAGLGLAITGLAFIGYAMPEFQVLLASGLPFCN